MAATQRTTVVGVFEDRRQADQAVAELKRLGFRDDQIGVAMRHGEGSTGTSAASGDATSDQGETYVEEGAAAGALAGLGLGALAGLGVLSGFIPVIGPALAGGTLGIVLSNAAAGAATLGLAGALVGYGIPEEEAEYYNAEFEAGRTIVTVQADGHATEVQAVMRRYGGYDMHTRGAASAAATTAATRTAGRTSAGSHQAGETLQVKEERLHAEKRPVEAGEVHVKKEVHTETRHLEIPVKREEVVIERTPVQGRESVHAGEIREGEEIRIPVREEKVNVSKDTIVTEEVKVGKHVVQDTEHVAAQVRKEDVKVEQEGDVDVKSRGTGKHTK